jgi:transglutaminase-like putative cysteine protease
VAREAVDAFSALDVLETRKAECQGHAYLYTALARASRIPTRVVNGLVYSEYARGFLYHTWAESLVDGRWLAVDPIFDQVGVDVTHVKLIEGETLGELTPLVGLIGRLDATVETLEPSGEAYPAKPPAPGT